MIYLKLRSLITSKYTVSTAMAVGVTSGLLFIMQYAIQTDGVEVKASTPGDTLTLLKPRKDRVTAIIEPEREPPPPVNPPPVVPRASLVTESSGWSIATDPGPVIGPQGLDGEVGVAAGDLLPIMTMPPEYPDRLRGRGVEGWVIVEFVVDELGRVRTPRIIEGSPASVFDRAALNAVSRYKYKPRVVNGTPVSVTGVRQRIVFNLG